MFVTKIPKGFPWQETVLLLGADFVTKIKDVPVGKGIQKDENGDYLVINGSELEKSFWLGCLSGKHWDLDLFSVLQVFHRAIFV